MTVIESAYEEWLNCKDKVVEINGELYFRIIHSEYFKLSIKEFLCVVLSPNMSSGKYLKVIE